MHLTGACLEEVAVQDGERALKMREGARGWGCCVKGAVAVARDGPGAEIRMREVSQHMRPRAQEMRWPVQVKQVEVGTSGGCWAETMHEV